LGLLESIKGKFLLSSFQNKSLKKFTEQNGWHTLEFKIPSPMTQGESRTLRGKVEVLAANYPISVKVDERSKKRIVSGEKEAGD
jgi:DNA adenine methylase